MWVMETFFTPGVLSEDLFINAAVGTFVIGTGMAMVFNYGASTGGQQNTLAKILHKYIHMDIGKALLVVDFVIGLASLATFGITAGLYALLAVVINGTLIDRLILGFNTSKELMIISKEQEIIKFISLRSVDKPAQCLMDMADILQRIFRCFMHFRAEENILNLRGFSKEIDPRAFIWPK